MPDDDKNDVKYIEIEIRYLVFVLITNTIRTALQLYETMPN